VCLRQLIEMDTSPQKTERLCKHGGKYLMFAARTPGELSGLYATMYGSSVGTVCDSNISNFLMPLGLFVYRNSISFIFVMAQFTLVIGCMIWR